MYQDASLSTVSTGIARNSLGRKRREGGNRCCLTLITYSTIVGIPFCVATAEERERKGGEREREREREREISSFLPAKPICLVPGSVFSPAQQIKTFIIVTLLVAPTSFLIITGYERRWEAHHASRYKGRK